MPATSIWRSGDQPKNKIQDRLNKHITPKALKLDKIRPDTNLIASPGNGLGLIQIQLDFFTWILMDLDLIGYGYPIALDSIGLDFVG